MIKPIKKINSGFINIFEKRERTEKIILTKNIVEIILIILL